MIHLTQRHLAILPLCLSAICQFVPGLLSPAHAEEAPQSPLADSSMVVTSPVLTLADCIALALEHNLQHRNNLRQFESTREQLRRAKAPFELNADASLTLPSYRDERDTFDDPALLSRFREENTRFNY